MLRKENCKVNEMLLSNFRVEVSMVKAGLLKIQLVGTSTVGSSPLSKKGGAFFVAVNGMKLLQVEQKGRAIRNCFEPMNVWPKETLLQYVGTRGWSNRRKSHDHRGFVVLQTKRFLSLGGRDPEKINDKMPSYLSGCSEEVPRKLSSLHNFSLKYPFKVVDRNLYSLVCQESLVYLAYDKLKSKKGSMTPALSPETLDGLSQDWVEKLLDQLRRGTFQFQPARRVLISKQSGGKKPLTIASPQDKIVQEMLRIILEIIYEPLFVDESFGFRPGKSCHSALLYIDGRFKSSTWCVRGDIKGCFANIDHSVMMALLQKKISDQKFLGLVKKSLKAGYGSLGQPVQANLIGTSQGSVLSPILCNIYLHEFDCFVLKQKKLFDKGKQGKRSAEYHRLSTRARRARAKGDMILAKSIVKQTSKIDSVHYRADSFKRLEYCRYVDDWIVGIRGAYDEAVNIKSLCSQFLEAQLKLRTAESKTAIINLNTHKVSFLGCMFFRSSIPTFAKKSFKNSEGLSFTRKVRVATSNLRLEIPVLHVRRKLTEAGFMRKNKPAPKTLWIPMEKDQIVGLYNSVFNGFANYYRFGANYGKFMSLLNWVLKLSCARTLAAKYQTRVAKIIKKYGADFGSIDGGVSFVKARFSNYRGLDRFAVSKKKPLHIVHALNARYKSMVHLKALDCMACGSDYKVEMHHVREMSNLRPNIKPFDKLMIRVKRKQIPLCRRCHMNYHFPNRRISS